VRLCEGRDPPFRLFFFKKERHIITDTDLQVKEMDLRFANLDMIEIGLIIMAILITIVLILSFIK